MANDFALGQKVHEHLDHLGLETPFKYVSRDKQTLTIGGIEHAFTEIMECLGLDLLDDSLNNTPHRVGKMFAEEIFYGLDYTRFPKCTTIENHAQVDEMVCIKDILVRSVCEHHFVPFIGRATVAYIPDSKIMGLSKFNRIVDFFSRRPQVQERLTEQVSAALRFVLETDDVAVVIEAEHYCVKLRGVEDPHSSTITSKLSGKFREVPELRNEFLQIARTSK